MLCFVNKRIGAIQIRNVHGSSHIMKYLLLYKYICDMCKAIQSAYDEMMMIFFLDGYGYTVAQQRRQLGQLVWLIKVSVLFV